MSKNISIGNSKHIKENLSMGTIIIIVSAVILILVVSLKSKRDSKKELDEYNKKIDTLDCDKSNDKVN